MSEIARIKIRKWQAMIAKEFGSSYEEEFQRKRLNKKRSKYKDPNYWNEESKKSLRRIVENHSSS